MFMEMNHRVIGNIPVICNKLMLSVCDNKKGNRLAQRIITLNCLEIFYKGLKKYTK